MSSFHKSRDNAIGIQGTKYKNNLPIVSSGIPSLDHIVGGGLPTGAIFLVEEDVLGNYCRVLSKYFLAEGVSCNHTIFIATADNDPKEIVKELPIPCAAPVEDEAPINAEMDKMKIAWRYEGLAQVESSFGNTSSFGHNFDLSKHIDADTISRADITYWIPDEDKTSGTSFHNPMYYSLLKHIKSVVSRDEHQVNSKCKKNILRVSIQSLGSPIWTAVEGHDTYEQDLIKFMYCLRVIVRDTHAVVFITMPSHLFDDETTVKRILYSTDNAVKIESFAGSSKETNPVYKDYHGLFHITKLCAINSLVQFVPPSLDMAFKLRRKKFIIEKLHLPPELQESAEREQDDITATPSCGGFKKKDIDF